MTDAEVLGHFESLGDNAEFGHVQRGAGVERAGLFRAADAPLSAVVRAFGCGFADLGDAHRVEAQSGPDAAVAVRIRGYGFRFAMAAGGGRPIDAVCALAAQLLDDVRARRRIFVRKGADTAGLEQIAPLLRVLRRYADVTVLWVVPRDAAHRSGTVEVIEAGLLKGYIDRFAPAFDPADVSRVWLDICRAALTLWRNASPPGTLAVPPPTPPVALTRPATRPYRLVTLAELAAEPPPGPSGRRGVEAISHLPAASLSVPAPGFGDPAPASRQERPPVPVYLMHHVVLRGKQGIMTLGGRVVAESLAHVALDAIPEAGWDAPEMLRLPDVPLSMNVHSGYHLLGCRLDRYDHWVWDVLARYRATAFDAFARQPETTGTPIVLVPRLDVFWKWESLGRLLPRGVPRAAIAADGQVFVERLLYVPDLAESGLAPHPAVLETFDAIRARVLAGPPPAPSRRLLAMRSGQVANAADLAACAERAGLAVVTLDKLSVPEQVRLFAEASHVVAPYGPDLINVGFCQPGAVLCELRPAGEPDWSYRALAALRGVRYGCLVGDAPDPARLDALLRMPPFAGQ